MSIIVGLSYSQHAEWLARILEVFPTVRRRLSRNDSGGAVKELQGAAEKSARKADEKTAEANKLLAEASEAAANAAQLRRAASIIEAAFYVRRT